MLCVDVAPNTSQISQGDGGCSGTITVMDDIELIGDSPRAGRVCTIRQGVPVLLVIGLFSCQQARGTAFLPALAVSTTAIVHYEVM